MHWMQRFRPITVERPKVLLPLVNAPLLEYTLEWLALNKIEEVMAFLGCSHIKQCRLASLSCLQAGPSRFGEPLRCGLPTQGAPSTRHVRRGLGHFLGCDIWGCLCVISCMLLNACASVCMQSFTAALLWCSSSAPRGPWAGCHDPEPGRNASICTVTLFFSFTGDVDYTNVEDDCSCVGLVALTKGAA